jgi:hypothetical protein
MPWCGAAGSAKYGHEHVTAVVNSATGLIVTLWWTS